NNLTHSAPYLYPTQPQNPQPQTQINHDLYSTLDDLLANRQPPKAILKTIYHNHDKKNENP
ncbi:hypothetical protein AAHH78_33305, partial [Burkholderia pseudomallei]